MQLLQLEREYLQLHRDITVQSLTVQPSVQNNLLTFIDSPLVKAVQNGRILLLDEADKAPLEVVSIIKSLIEDGEMVLTDGRRIVKNATKPNEISIHPNFRMIVLANKPGFPFHGNDFFRECGDLFSAHYIDNPKMEDEVILLQSYAPDVPREILEQLSRTFTDLRKLVENELLHYPYSTRELVNIVKHMQQFPDDGIASALKNVLDFDSYEKNNAEQLKRVFEKHGIPVDIPAELHVEHAEVHKVRKELLYKVTLEKSTKTMLRKVVTLYQSLNNK